MTGTSTTKSKKEHAFAIFAKAPKAGRVKTRLAKDIGETSATYFYQLCLEKIKKTFTLIKEKQNIEVYWALPHEEYLTVNTILFSNFPIISQGSGTLGEKLAHTQDSLFNLGHKRASLVGSDSPQIESITYIDFCTLTEKNNDLFMGPADDGGFYLFSSTEDTSKEFLNTNYSKETTLKELIQNFKATNKNYKLLESHFDIDHYSDLGPLEKQLLKKSLPLAEDIALIEEIKKIKKNEAACTTPL